MNTFEILTDDNASKICFTNADGDKGTILARGLALSDDMLHAIGNGVVAWHQTGTLMETESQSASDDTLPSAVQETIAALKQDKARLVAEADDLRQQITQLQERLCRAGTQDQPGDLDDEIEGDEFDAAPEDTGTTYVASESAPAAAAPAPNGCWPTVIKQSDVAYDFSMSETCAASIEAHRGDHKNRILRARMSLRTAWATSFIRFSAQMAGFVPTNGELDEDAPTPDQKERASIRGVERLLFAALEEGQWPESVHNGIKGALDSVSEHQGQFHKHCSADALAWISYVGVHAMLPDKPTSYEEYMQVRSEDREAIRALNTHTA